MNKKYILPVALASLMLASCADEFDPQIAPVQAPIDAAKQAELGDLKPLKEYVDRSAHPDFKISGALTASTFNDKTDLYHVAVTNFDEIVAGNAMKMSSVVSDKGEFNYSTVNQFVQTADEAGLTIYGHTLAWHAQQPVKWLTKLLADRQKPKGDPVEVTVDDFVLDWGTKSSYDMWGSGAETAIADGALKITNSEVKANFWECQYMIASSVKTDASTKYHVEVEFAASGDGDNCCVRYKLGDWSNGGTGQVNVAADGEFQKFSFDVVSGLDADCFLLIQFGDFVGTLSVRNVKITHTTMQEPANDDVEYKEYLTEKNKRCIMIESDDLVEYGWDTQLWLKTSKPMHSGDSYEFSADVYAWHEASVGTQLHNDPGAYVHWSAIGNVNFGEEWANVTATGSIPSEGDGTYTIAFNLNDYNPANHYYLSNISLLINGEQMIVNGDLASDDNSAFFKKEKRGDIVNIPIQDTYIFREVKEVPKVEEIHVDKRCIIVESEDLVDYAWDTQFWIQTNEPFHSGDSYEFTAELRADNECAPGTQVHKGSAGGYLHWAAIGNPNFSTEWETVKLSGTIPSAGDGGDFIAWNLNDYASANKFYIGYISFKINGVEMLNNCDLSFDDISSFWKKEKRGATVHAPISDGYTIYNEVKSTIPLTDEEKKDTLIYAMNKWIAGMMDATEGKVKAWDLVNEAISGGGDVEGNYALQHGSADNTTDFFWQDYLGDVDYVRVAARAARAEYANAMKAQELTDDGKLKLFINDYNLESDWDQNKKLKSLIYWIGKWEEDGETKIDGIGTQMHISYYENAETQASKKAAITNMFELMAKTGKLVRISELDMGYVDAEGKTIGWADMAEDYLTGYTREKAMEEFYEWIIQEYFRVVPAAQQYGICQWCLTDATGKVGDSSGWRPGEPVGLWDTNWYRKYTYRGYVNGLSK